MSLKHNKKRNVGLLNEFFARYIAKAIVEHRDLDIKKAKELFSKHFHKGTDLYRELRMFSTLFETHLVSREVANSLIEQVKTSCKLQSQAKLDLEKSALLHEVNIHLNDPKFFDQDINEFRNYATIQVLMNHWRGGILTENLSEAAQLEDKLLQHITNRNTIIEKKDVLKMTTSDVDGLVVNIMTEKLNEKYSSALNSDQKKILQLYVFSHDDGTSKTALVEMLEQMRIKTLSKIQTVLLEDKSVVRVSEKLKEVKTLLQEDFRDTSNLDDKLITFYMTVSKLQEELND